MPTKPAAAPDHVGAGVWPPTVMLSESAKAGAGFGGKKPSTMVPLYGPKPVPSNEMVSPAAAGLSEVTGEPSAWSANANCCEFTVLKNNPGESRTTVKGAVTGACPAT